METPPGNTKVKDFRQLRVCQTGFGAAMRIFEK